MARLRFTGLKEYELQLSRLQRGADEIAGKAIYAGAEIIADAIKQNIQGLPSKTGTTRQGLLEGFGIAPLQDDSGYLNVKIGFDGYNAKGVPNALMARLFESGTSKVPKHPFVRPAINSSRKRAEARMAEVLDEEIKKIMDK